MFNLDLVETANGLKFRRDERKSKKQKAANLSRDESRKEEGSTPLGAPQVSRQEEGGRQNRHSILELYQKFWACPVTCRLKAAAREMDRGRRSSLPPLPFAPSGDRSGISCASFKHGNS